MSEMVIPAQVRAARSLLNWSQEQLAEAAEVGITSIRDLESNRRAPATQAGGSVRRALQNAGVEFVSGGPDFGPGVRFVGGRPNIITWPSAITMWDGLPFKVEWHGKEIVVFVSQEMMDDLGHHTGKTSSADYLKTFERHKGLILDALVKALKEPNSIKNGRLHLISKYFPPLP